jgi:hypothetical protein
MKKYIVTLTEDERENLGGLTSKGKHRSQKILNALIFFGMMRVDSRKNVRPTKKLAKC